MGANSSIEWTDHTMNPWRGCTKVSAGCTNCYADTKSKRNPGTLGVWGPRGTRVVAAESYWRQPLRWNAEAERDGVRRRVFCASLADVFEGPETMPESEWSKVEAARDRLFGVIPDTPHLDWLLLTKRPQNALRYAPIVDSAGRHWRRDGWPENIWIGTSVENQAAADERIPHLLRVPARVRFLSCEPLLGPVDLRDFIGWHPSDIPDDSKIHWVIVGGESGAKARPMHPAWARSLRDQCQAAGVSYFFKQWGEFSPCPDGVEFSPRVPVHQFQVTHHDGESWKVCYTPVYKLGKHAAGRLLDGREWNEVPQ